MIGMYNRGRNNTARFFLSKSTTLICFYLHKFKFLVFMYFVLYSMYIHQNQLSNLINVSPHTEQFLVVDILVLSYYCIAILFF